VVNGRTKARRYNEIISVFAKHGFGYLMEQLGILNFFKIKLRRLNRDDEANNSRLSTGERLRLACEKLGPTFVKLGQILSTRGDIFSPDVVKELMKLQDSVQPFSFAEVRTVIESELEDKLENVYKEFEEKPLASASVSQVHYARLNSGKPVAVKVQRPGIEKNIHLDLDILKDIAHFIDNHTKYGKMYDFSNMVLEFENTLKNELDFTKEAENAEKFQQNFRRDEGITVPQIKWIYTTRRILTMEYIEGLSVNDHKALEQAGIDRKKLAKKLFASVCNQILRDGFFHADPHPGNIKVMPDGTIVFLDFGMVGSFNETQKRTISNFFIGIVAKDSKMVVWSILDLNSMSKRNNLKKFEKDVDKIIEKYLTLPWNEIKIGDLFYEIFNIAYLNHFKFPHEFTLLAKALATSQGLAEKLAPDLNALVVAKPIAKKLLYQSFSPRNLSKDMIKSIFNYKSLWNEFPSAMLNFLGKMEDGNFVIQFEIKDIGNIQKRVDRTFNRISFSVVLLAVSIIIAGIIIGSGLSASTGSEMALLNITVLKIGLAIAAVILVGLVISMFRSNRL